MRARPRVFDVRFSYRAEDSGRSVDSGTPRRSSTRRPGSAKKVDEKTIGARDSFRELAKEGNARVDVQAFAVTSIDESAVQVRLARIVHGEKRRVFGVELRPEIEAAFLDPAFEIALRDLVRAIQKRIVGLEKFHRRVFVGDARQRTRSRGCAFLYGGRRWRDQRGIGREGKFVPSEIALVLHQESAAFGSVIEQALVHGWEVGTQLVGAHTDDHGVKFGEVTEGERLRIEQLDMNAKHTQSVGDGLAFRGDVTDAKALRHVDSKGVDETLRRLRPEQRGHSRQRFERESELLIFAAGTTIRGVVGASGNLVVAGGELERQRYFEASVLVANAVEAEGHWSAYAPKARCVEADADLAGLRRIGVDAKQDVERFSRPWRLGQNADDLRWLDGEGVWRHHARSNTIRARGSGPDAGDRRSGGERVAIEHDVLRGSYQLRWLGKQSGRRQVRIINRDSLRPKKPLGTVLRKPQSLWDRDREANRAVRFRVLFDDVPVRRKSEADFPEVAVEGVAVMRLDVDGERLPGNQLATIADCIEPDAGDKNQRGVDFFTLAVNALEKGLDRSGSLARKSGQRNLVKLFAGGDQEIGGRLPIQAEGGAACGNEGRINRTHEGINTPVAYLEVLIERAEGYVEGGDVEVTTVFALERDGAAEKG